MRGGFVHNRLLLEPLAIQAAALGVNANTEVAPCLGRRAGYADLVLEFGDHRIVVEAEFSGRRIVNDLRKAAGLRATELWLVVPDNRAARSVRQSLGDHHIRPKACGIFVFTLPQAIKRLGQIFPLISGSNVLSEMTVNKKTNRTRGNRSNGT